MKAQSRRPSVFNEESIQDTKLHAVQMPGKHCGDSSYISCLGFRIDQTKLFSVGMVRWARLVHYAMVQDDCHSRCTSMLKNNSAIKGATSLLLVFFHFIHKKQDVIVDLAWCISQM